MSKITNAVVQVLKNIRDNGKEINRTKEVINMYMSFRLGDLDLAEEEQAVRKWYDDIGENYTARMKVEMDHYKFLEYAMKHKISEIQYFHKGEDNTSRKFIVFSGDCINCINLLYRPNGTTLNVFMRSSDSLRLLPADILNSIKILRNVQNRHYMGESDDDEVNFWITSCHWYLRDKDIVDQIIKTWDGKWSATLPEQKMKIMKT